MNSDLPTKITPQPNSIFKPMTTPTMLLRHSHLRKTILLVDSLFFFRSVPQIPFAVRPLLHTHSHSNPKTKSVQHLSTAILKDLLNRKATFNNRIRWGTTRFRSNKLLASLLKIIRTVSSIITGSAISSSKQKCNRIINAKVKYTSQMITFFSKTTPQTKKCNTKSVSRWPTHKDIPKFINSQISSMQINMNHCKSNKYSRRKEAQIKSSFVKER